MRILAVDDDALSLDILKSALEKQGHTVVAASDGEEAMSLLGASPFRLVITDWLMPKMDGPALCRWIREQVFHGYVYVIMLTARTDRADVIEGLRAGADEFLLKPFDPMELEARIRTAERILSTEYHHIAIFALAKLAESRDPETGLHLDRIREYCLLLGNCLLKRPGYDKRLSVRDLEMIYYTSPLHDIGKVGVPDAILRKPGALDHDEFEIMKTHSIIGGKTLGQALAQYPGALFLKTARDIAFWHHERFDGTGYPHGLAGEDIPLCARIVALADVYDALTSKRPYKKAFPHEEARRFIVEQRGRHFDPDLVDAFLAAESAFAEIARRLSDSDSSTAAPAEPVAAAGSSQQ